MELVTDKRVEYAERLRKLADHIESHAYQPLGFIFLFFHNSPMDGYEILQKNEEGFRNFDAIGVMEKLKVRLLSELKFMGPSGGEVV